MRIIDTHTHFFTDDRTDADKNYLKKMIHEIILNALKFSRKDSPVTIIIDIVDERFNMHVLNLPEKNEKGIIGS